MLLKDLLFNMVKLGIGTIIQLLFVAEFSSTGPNKINPYILEVNQMNMVLCTRIGAQLQLKSALMTTACNSSKHGRGWDLNYPSFSGAVEDGHEVNALFTRKVTNGWFTKFNSPC